MTETSLLAYPGGPDQRARNIALMEAHAAADELVKGQYWEGGKGCAVGCILHDYGHRDTSDHAAFEPLFGVPRDLAQLQDTIFENLPNEEAMRWPSRFWTAIQPGADLSLVTWQFLAFVVEEALARKGAESVREACQPAPDVVRRLAGAEVVPEEEAAAAARAARATRAARAAAWVRYAEKLLELMAAAPTAEHKAALDADRASYNPWHTDTSEEPQS